MIGWIGSACLALCGLPMVIKTYKEGHANGVSLYFLLLWFIGEVLSLIYSLDKDVLPLLFNYGFNILFISIVLYYKLKKATTKEPLDPDTDVFYIDGV